MTLTKRLICHIGTHKTGTTSFQRFCYKFNDLLLQEKVCYPIIERYKHLNNHAPLAWALNKRNSQKAEGMLDEIFNIAKKYSSELILLSSEDFENCLICDRQFNNLLAKTKLAGIPSLEIIVTTRQPIDYLNSIYAELSTQNGVLNFTDIAISTLNSEYFMHSTHHFNHIFATNPKPLIQRFRLDNPKIKVHHYEYSEFSKGFPGKIFFQTILSREKIKTMETIGLAKTINNARLSPIDVEINYTKNFLGIPKEAPLNPDLLQTITAIANQRLKQANKWRAQAEALLKSASSTPNSINNF